MIKTNEQKQFSPEWLDYLSKILIRPILQCSFFNSYFYFRFYVEIALPDPTCDNISSSGWHFHHFLHKKKTHSFTWHFNQLYNFFYHLYVLKTRILDVCHVRFDCVTVITSFIHYYDHKYHLWQRGQSLGVRNIISLITVSTTHTPINYVQDSLGSWHFCSRLYGLPVTPFRFQVPFPISSLSFHCGK